MHHKIFILKIVKHLCNLQEKEKVNFLRTTMHMITVKTDVGLVIYKKHLANYWRYISKSTYLM